MAIKKCDVMLIGKNAAGDRTVNMPITRLGNIEDSAEIKEKPAAGDYIPIMDMEDGGQMKKFLYTPSENAGSSGSENTHRFYQKDVTLYDIKNNPKIKIELNVAAYIYDITIDGVKHKAANGCVQLKSFSADVSDRTTGSVVLSASDNAPYGNLAHSVGMFILQNDKLYEFFLPFSPITDDEIPFYIKQSGIYFRSTSDTGNSPPYNYYQPCQSFFFVEGV